MGNDGKDSYKWVVLAISFFLMMGFALSLQVLPPLFDQIIKDVPFSNSQAGMLMGAYAIPGIFLPFLVAFLANRFDMKIIIMAALIIMIVGSAAFASAGSFSLLFVYRLIAGVGATVLVVLAPLLITMYFDQKNIGIAMGIFNIAVPLGTVLAANLSGYLGGIWGWKVVMSGIAVYLAIILAIVFFTLSLSKNKVGANSNDAVTETPSKFGSSLNLWLLAAIWALGNAQLLAYLTFGPQFYQTVGMSAQRAGFLTSLAMLISIFLTPIVGIIFDKTGRKKPFLLIGNALILVSFIFLAKQFFALPLWAFALGVGFAPISVFVFASLPEIVKPHEVGMGLGMLTVASNLGTTLGPTALGSILDLTAGKFFAAFTVLALVSLVAIVISLRLKPASSRHEG